MNTDPPPQSQRDDASDARPDRLELRINPAFEREREENSQTLRTGLILLAIVTGLLVVGVGIQRWLASHDQASTTATTSSAPSAITQQATPMPQPVRANADITVPQAKGLTVVSIELGSAVGADNRIVVPTMNFGPMDTIHASVATDGAGGLLGIRWSYEDGQLVDRQEKQVASGSQTTDFSVSKPDGWPLGSYHVEITRDGRPIASRDFAVTSMSARIDTPGQGGYAADQNSGYVDSLGIDYQYQRNTNGAVLRSSVATIYLGKDCDAVSPQYGNGTWSWANGGFLISFENGNSLGFPRQEIDAGNGMACQN